MQALTWSQSGTLLTGSVGNFESVFIRDTDTSNNATVEARQLFNGWNVNGEAFGVVCNKQSTDDFYMLAWLTFTGGGDRLRLFRRTPTGFIQLTNVTKSYTAATFTLMKITSVDNGANKDLIGFVDGVSETTATTVQLTDGRGGVFASVKGASNSADTDWWALDTVIAINSVTPSAGISDETTPVVIDGDDFGDGTLVDVGVQSAQNVVVVSPTQINCDFPPSASGKVNVIVKFGTP